VAENGKPPSPSVIPGSVSSLPPPLATTSR
jgi:hypothetical protein